MTVFGPRDRRERFEHAHPDVRSGLAAIALEADRLALEADWPGWRVTVCEHAGFRHWVAAEEDPDGGLYPLGGPVVCADSADGLRAALAEFGA